jgi:hypothetical protein
LPQVEVSFPISPGVCLLLDNVHGQQRRRLAGTVVDELNRRTVCSAERFVISPIRTRQIAGLVKEFAHTRGRPKMDRDEMVAALRESDR